MYISTRHRVALVIVVVVVLILIFLGVFLALGKMKRSSEGSTVIPPDFNRPHHSSSLPITKGLLANTIDCMILLMDLESYNYNLMVDEYFYGVTAFDYYLNESVYYATTKPFEPIKSTSERYGELMQKSRYWTKTALAVDFVTQKVYVIDGDTEQLNLMDFRGYHFAILMTDLNEPKDIILDPARGLMFILQASSILQANMDGTEVKTILEEPDLVAFTLDRESNKIYYSNSCAVKSVEYIDDSNSPVLITTDDAVSSLAILDNQLYFIGTFKKSNRRFLTACSIVGDICKKFRHNVIDPRIASKLQSIKAYDNQKLVPRNPCEWNNGECEHLCVLTDSRTRRGYTCVCSAGYQLNSDQKTCVHIDDYLLYIEDNKIKRSVLETGNKLRTAVDSNTLIDASAVKLKKLIHFDYSYDRHFLVYADYSNVHYVDLINGTTWIIEGSVDCDLIPAVDWLSNNLYYARNCGNQNSDLMVRSVDSKTAFENENFLVRFAGHVGALVIHPFRRIFFFTQFSKKFDKYLLHGMHADGGNYDFGRKIAAYETGLCIDYVDGRLYWLSEDATKILYMNLDDFIPKTVDVSVIRYPRTVSVFKHWLYISNLTEIWQVDKETGCDATRLVPIFTGKLKVIHDAKVFSQVLQPIDKHH